jgi:hypothetical protein
MSLLVHLLADRIENGRDLYSHHVVAFRQSKLSHEMAAFCQRLIGHSQKFNAISIFKVPSAFSQLT